MLIKLRKFLRNRLAKRKRWYRVKQLKKAVNAEQKVRNKIYYPKFRRTTQKIIQEETVSYLQNEGKTQVYPENPSYFSINYNILIIYNIRF
ncbi:hypothetical protein SAMN04488518_101211 [Pseudovibrio ascidiaceicola]|uniref:Uncharacterized protein n=1 Tax=Pseudovibrio ascidiaceicola TaxID=285279 RepID=A0A1I3V8D1_9HYPH|nr:hypothetical protein SAMN04488518_101211 [Pseudovibrio ascidiaceicola]